MASSSAWVNEIDTGGHCSQPRKAPHVQAFRRKSPARPNAYLLTCRAIAAVALISAAAQAQAPTPLPAATDFDRTQFIAQKLASNVYALTGSPNTDPGHPEGAGGRVGVLVGRDGVLMVDASYAPLSEKIEAEIRKISPAPIRYVVNTHSHPDHTGGNPHFAKVGAVILAREETFQTQSCLQGRQAGRALWRRLGRKSRKCKPPNRTSGQLPPSTIRP
jgi:hypothetical protein